MFHFNILYFGNPEILNSPLQKEQKETTFCILGAAKECFYSILQFSSDLEGLITSFIIHKNFPAGLHIIVLVSSSIRVQGKH